MSKNIFKLNFEDGKANIFCHTDKNESQIIKYWENELNVKCINSKRVYEYLGRYWKIKKVSDMYNNYEGWKNVIFELADTDEKCPLLDGVNYINGKFNKLTDEIHIAIEKLSYDPDDNFNYHQLFVAFKNFDNWQGEIPEWNDKYLN